MNEHLFLGDSTYPHTPQKDEGGFIITKQDDLVSRLRDMASKKYNYTWAGWVQSQTTLAADRIEQLERELEGYKDTHLSFMQLGMKHERLLLNHENLCAELAEAQKGHARYEFVRKLNVYQFKKIFTMNLTSAVRFDDLIDAAIKEGKA